MDVVTIIIFIVFLLFRFLGQSKQQGNKGGRPSRPRPQQNGEERPWWEDVGEVFKEDPIGAPRKEEPAPIVLKRERVTRTEKVKDSPTNKFKKERELAKKRLAQARKDQQKKVEVESASKSPYSAQNFNAQTARQGIIWAEILQAPKAKRRQGHRSRI